MRRLVRPIAFKTLSVALRATLLGVFAAATLYAAFDCARTQILLSNDGIARLQKRASTDAPSAPVASRRAATRVVSQAQTQRARELRDERLTSAARAFVDAAPEDEATRRQIALRGLARWDVEETCARELIAAPEDARLFADSPRESFDRSSDATAYALESLASLQEPDARDESLVAALEFLAACEPEPPSASSENWTLWTLEYDNGDPLDFGGYVATDEFELARYGALTRRARSTTALFGFATFFFALVDRRVVLAWARSVRSSLLAFAFVPLFRTSRPSLASNRFDSRYGMVVKFATFLLSVRLLI